MTARLNEYGSVVVRTCILPKTMIDMETRSLKMRKCPLTKAIRHLMISLRRPLPTTGKWRKSGYSSIRNLYSTDSSTTEKKDTSPTSTEGSRKRRTSKLGPKPVKIARPTRIAFADQNAHRRQLIRQPETRRKPRIGMKCWKMLRSRAAYASHRCTLMPSPPPTHYPCP